MPRVLGSLRQQFAAAWQITPGKPALWLGLRAALTATAPVVLGIALDRPAAVWAVAAGFTATTVDKGGAYRTRAAGLGSLFVLGTAGVLLGALVASDWVRAAVSMMAWAAILGFAPAYGDAATSVATASTVLFAVSLGVRPNGIADIWTRMEWLCAGMAWACALTLGLWPVRVYRPGRLAVADVFSRLAEHARLLAAAIEARLHAEPPDSRTPGALEWGDAVRRDHRALRDAIENARRVLAATRRGRRSEAGRGERLLVLLEIAEQVFAELVALTDRLESATPAQSRHALATLADLAIELSIVARRTVTEARTATPPGTPEVSARMSDPPPSHSPATSLETVLRRACTDVHLASAVVTTLYGDEPLPEAALANRAAANADADADADRASKLEPLRQNLTFDSEVLRHALRLGVTAALAILLVHFAEIRRGSWVTLTVVLLLQPHAPATRKKIVQRVGGTMLGGLLAAVIVATVHDVGARLAIVAIFAAMSTAVLQLNYGLFSVFLTPTFVLLGELGAPDATLAYVRMENTLVGGLLALLAASFLWPHGERDRLPARVADVFAALASYASAIARCATNGVTPAERVAALTQARRACGLAINNAEASFERLLSELGTNPDTMAPWMSILTYSRRVVGALSVRTLHVPPDLAIALKELESAVRAQRTVTPLNTQEAKEERPADDARIMQLTHVLATAVDRAAGQRL